MFGAYEYIRRSFDYIIRDERREENEEKSEMLPKVLPIIEEKLATKTRNLFILPVLDCQPIDELIFPKVGYTIPENSSVP